MQKSVIVMLILALVIALILPVSASVVKVAVGDSIGFSGNVSGLNTISGRVWVFGNSDAIYAIPFDVHNGRFDISIPSNMVESLDVGKYKLYLQFPGKNNIYDFYYENSTIKVIYKDMPDINILGAPSYVAEDGFTKIIGNTKVDDVIIPYDLFVELPSIKLVNMYTRGNGNFHLDFSTNLAPYDSIRAVIDEDQYATPHYANMMTCETFVIGEDAQTFSVEYPGKLADQLTSGQHTINIHYLGDKVLSVPFKRYTKLVDPTPTPEVIHYYDFTGEELGYKVNTTRPYEAPVVTPTPTITYPTSLVDIRFGNRVVEPRTSVYLGEKNLDVYGTLGWQDPDTYNYDFKLSYCDGDNSVITVKEPRHFYVDPEIFKNKPGAWCQYQSNIDEKDAPVAFFVHSIPYNVNLSSLSLDSNGNVVVAATMTPEPTTTPQETNITATMEQTTVPTPEPTETIQLPLPLWIILVSLISAVVLCRK